MLTIRTLPILAVTFLTAIPASAVTFNVSPFIQWLDADFGTGDASLGIRGGVSLPLGRVEFEYANSDLNAEKEVVFEGQPFSGVGEGDAHLFLVNYRYTHMFTDRVGAYAGAGVGGTMVDFSYRANDVDVSGDGTDLVATFQFFGGIEFYILPSLSVSGGFKWISWSDALLEEQGVEIEVVTGESNSWEVALNFYF